MLRNVEEIPDTEQYAECERAGCCYEGTVGMTLFEADGKQYCSRHAKPKCQQCGSRAVIWIGGRVNGLEDWYRCLGCSWEVCL